MKFSAAVLATAFAVAKANTTSFETAMQEGKRKLADMSATGCRKEPLSLDYLAERYNIDLATASPDIIEALLSAVAGQLALGSSDQLIAEANDASRRNAVVADGFSGDINFPFGPFKVLITVGELNYCVEDEGYGDSYTGVPDGAGAYLVDDETLRIVVQSESYGTITQQETWPYEVNGGAATFTGSHVHFIDYDRTLLANFMNYDGPASDMIKSFGQTSLTYYNLAGEFVGPRNRDGPTTYGAHFSNTDAEGNYVVQGQEGATNEPTEADWIMQSLCSAHLEQKHQWGAGIGFEDDVYITNEEWIRYQANSPFVGISAHVQDLANRVDYAIGSVTNTGFEKIVELNPMHEDYIILGVSGYNGDYGDIQFELDARNAEYGNRPDGTPYVAPENVVPARIYVGVKGKMEDGSDALDEDDFLARNGLRYGKLYGFATNINEMSEGMYRDAFHKPRANGAKVEGKFVAIDWSWNGTVTNFRHDGAWDFQLPVPNQPEGWDWWTANGPSNSGAKTEHLSPDTREGLTAFVQGSTAGYFGHYYVRDVLETLNMAGGQPPAEFPAEYYVYQGEQDIVDQINLGGAGLYSIEGAAEADCAVVVDASQNCDNPSSVKRTFEDVDGFEVIAAKEGLFAIIQEDSGNELGERMFISELTHSGTELTYYFMAMSGGKFNTRMGGNVGIPAGTNTAGNSHEFSGIIDLSGMLAMQPATGGNSSGGSTGGSGSGSSGSSGSSDVPSDSEGAAVGYLTEKTHAVTTWKYAAPGTNRRAQEMEWVVNAGDGRARRQAEHEVSINDKDIIINLQAHNLENAGAVAAFQADRGGQIYLYRPTIPEFMRRYLRA